MPGKKGGSKEGKKGPPFTLRYTEEADSQLVMLQTKPALGVRWKAVRKALGFLSLNPKYPSLNTHEFSGLDAGKDQNGKLIKVWEAYAQNKTPGAYRIFWHYGPEGDEITVLSVTPHP